MQLSTVFPVFLYPIIRDEERRKMAFFWQKKPEIAVFFRFLTCFPGKYAVE